MELLRPHLLLFQALFGFGESPPPPPQNLVTPAALVLAQPAPEPPEVKLEVTGGNVQVVKVDQVIIVKKDVTVITSFPFEVHAPRVKGARYSWQLPNSPGIQAFDKGSVLEILQAPQGPLTVGLKMEVIDFKAQDIFTSFGSAAFNIGKVTTQPPTPEKPDPPAPTPLGFDTLVRTELAKLGPDAEASRLAPMIATNFVVAATKVQNKEFPTFQDANKWLQTENRKVITDVGTRALWRPLFEAWSARANELRLSTLEQYAQAYTETASALSR